MVLVGKPEGRRNLEDRRVDGRIILKWMRGWMVGMDGVGVVQDRERCRAVVNTMMNLRVPYYAKNFFSSSGRVSFSERTLLHGFS